jgi:hypothetical protein
MFGDITTLQLLICVVLAGVAGSIVGAKMTRPAVPQFDTTNALRKAITSALIRGYQGQLVKGWGDRHAHCTPDLAAFRHEDYLASLDQLAVVELVTRGYETSQSHMQTLGWLAHAIGYDVRKYEGN